MIPHKPDEVQPEPSTKMSFTTPEHAKDNLQILILQYFVSLHPTYLSFPQMYIHLLAFTLFGRSSEMTSSNRLCLRLMLMYLSFVSTQDVFLFTLARTVR